MLPDESTPELYGRISAQLAQTGTPIPQNDIWIAASVRDRLPSSLICETKIAAAASTSSLVEKYFLMRFPANEARSSNFQGVDGRLEYYKIRDNFGWHSCSPLYPVKTGSKLYQGISKAKIYEGQSL